MAPRVWLLPLLAGLVRKADEIAAALLSRGWSPGHGGPVPPTPLGERWLWAAGAAPLIVLGVALALTRLYQAGVFALPWLDWVYDLTARFV
jgi:energy-coupling factor transporter transmembrane protein EcfT